MSRTASATYSAFFTPSVEYIGRLISLSENAYAFGIILRLVAESASAVRAHRVQSNEVHAHADVARFQLFDELVARNRQALRYNAQHIQMAAVVAVIRRLLQPQLRHIGKRLLR